MASRSRFIDFAPINTALSLTENDIAIFSVLQELPYLPLPHLAELLGYSKAVYVQGGKQIVRYPTLRARLARLRKDGGYLKCPAESWRAANARYRPAVYTLTPKARDELRRRGFSRHAYRLGNDFAHDLGSCLIPASFKIGVRATDELRFVPASEILAHEKCPQATRQSSEPFVIPVSYYHRNQRIETQKQHDWQPFGIAYQYAEGRERKILFPGHEFDRDTEPLDTADAARTSITRHLLSILALLDYGYERHFGTGRFFVPIVTIGETRMRSIMRLLLKLTEGKGSKHVLFKNVDDFASFANFPPATGHMLTVPWQRAGYEDFDILKEIGAKN